MKNSSRTENSLEKRRGESRSEQWKINPNRDLHDFCLTEICVKMAVKETLNRDIFNRPTRQRLIGIVNRRGGRVDFIFRNCH